MTESEGYIALPLDSTNAQNKDRYYIFIVLCVNTILICMVCGILLFLFHPFIYQSLFPITGCFCIYKLFAKRLYGIGELRIIFVLLYKEKIVRHGCSLCKRDAYIANTYKRVDEPKKYINHPCDLHIKCSTT